MKTISYFIIFCFITFKSYSQIVHFVTSSDDNDSLSLRQIINNANNGDTVKFNLSYNDTIKITLGVITINKDLTIYGENSDSIIVSGNKLNNIFRINPDKNVTFINLKLVYGNNSRGGAIRNHGKLTISNTRIEYNEGSWGGAINNDGNLTIIDSKISHNEGSWGGAIFNIGNIDIKSSILDENSGLWGGSIFNDGLIQLELCGIENNFASWGGGIINYGTFYIDSSYISHNTGTWGGAIFNSSDIDLPGELFIKNSSISNNTGWLGGGITNNHFGKIFIESSAISENEASGFGGGLENNDNGEVRISNSTIAKNQALNGGGIINNKTLIINNSTFSENSNQYGSEIITTSYMKTSNTIFNNSIFNTGSIISEGYNLCSNNSYVFNAIGDHNNVSNLHLGPFQYNGGFTFTCALDYCSVAIDAANPVLYELDQRGQSVFGGRRDIGAYERQENGGVPIIHEIISAFGCDEDFFDLEAYTDNGVINWYSSSIGNELISTGSIFSTPVINSNTTYWVEASNDECTSVRHAVNVVIVNIDSTVSINEITLISNSIEGDYQWIDCDNDFSPIPNANDRYFTPEVNGNFAVIVTIGACTKTSECTNINSVHLNEMTENIIKIFPNPTSENITIDINFKKINSFYYIYDYTGKLIKSGKLIDIRNQINLNELSNGIYLLSINGLTKEVFHLVKL